VVVAAPGGARVAGTFVLVTHVSSPPVIDAVVFDLGGVFTHSPFEALREAGEASGTDYLEALHIVFGPYDTDTDHPWHRAERGQLGFDDCRAEIRELAVAAGHDLDLLDVVARMGGGAMRPDVVELTRAVRASGRRTALLTNNIVEGRPWWRPKLPLDELFDAVVDSSEVGMRKPDPAIYHHTLALIDVEPERAVFVDDYEGNVVAARQLGMVGVLVEADHAGAMAELVELLALDPQRLTPR
jgi:epoxide hydrolase-like predicted phosphatase